MATGTLGFKRVVLGLQPSAPSDTMQFAVDLAGLLRLDLLGLFLEESSLRNLPNIPVARELRLLGGGWQPIDLTRMTADLELAARSAERMFVNATRRVSVRCRFEVARGSTTEVITSVSHTGDIVMIVEPPSPAERAAQQFIWLVEAAFRSAADVMVAPRRFARTTGQIVAIATTPDDPSIQTAANIARAANEELVIVEAGRFSADDPRLRDLASETGLSIKRVSMVEPPAAGPGSYVDALHNLHERLVIMTHGARADETALAIASARHVPVLVIEPSAATSAGSLQSNAPAPAG